MEHCDSVAHLVDQTIDTLSQRIPAQSLILGTLLILGRLGLHCPQPRRGDIGTTTSRSQQLCKLCFRAFIRRSASTVHPRHRPIPVTVAVGLAGEFRADLRFEHRGFTLTSSERVDIHHSRSRYFGGVGTTLRRGGITPPASGWGRGAITRVRRR